MNEPEASLYEATLKDREYCWKPDDFPRALTEATTAGLVCLGGQFQFQLPEGTCEMYWLAADSAPQQKTESWQEYVTRSNSEVKLKFEQLRKETDFMAEADSFVLLQEKKKQGIDLVKALWFVAYFISENENG